MNKEKQDWKKELRNIINPLVHHFVDKSTMEKQECGQKEESPKSLSFCEDVSGQLSFYQEKVS